MAHKPIKRVPVPGFIYVIAAFAGLGGFLFGYDTGAISGALLYIKKDMTLTTFQQELVVAVLLFCAAMSAPFAGISADRFGRKKVVIAAALFFIVGALLMAFTPGYKLLILGRAFVGVAIGFASMTVPLYVAEMSPPNIRGLCVSLNQFLITVGILVAYGVDLSFSGIDGGWRWMLGLPMIPAAILLIAMFFLPESPRWLIKHGHKERAKTIFKKLGMSDIEMEGTLQEISKTASHQKSDFKQLLKPSIRPALVIGILLAVFQQISGINTVIYYAPTLLASIAKETDVAALIATVGIGSVNVFITAIALYLLDRVGRRPLLLVGTSFMIISLIILGMEKWIPHGEEWITWIYNGSLFLYIAGFAIGLGPVAWLFIAEIYPMRIRGVAMSCATFANWAANFIVAITFLSLLNTLGPSLTFWFYAVIAICTFLFIYFYIPETKGKTLEEIELSFKKGGVTPPLN